MIDKKVEKVLCDWERSWIEQMLDQPHICVDLSASLCFHDKRFTASKTMNGAALYWMLFGIQ